MLITVVTVLDIMDTFFEDDSNTWEEEDDSQNYEALPHNHAIVQDDDGQFSKSYIL